MIVGSYDATVGHIGDDDITLFKNGGGAQLDLMTARYIIVQRTTF